MLQSSRPGPLPGRVVSAEQMAEHEKLVRWVVRQQSLGKLPFADALHEGRLGLWEAFRYYDPARGYRFSTYAVPTIAHAVWKAVAVERQFGQSAPSGPLSLAADPTDFADLIHRSQVHRQVNHLVAQLPARLSQVIVAHYGLDQATPQTFAAIGRLLGLTRQRVQQLHGEALLWLAHPAHSLSLRRLLDRHGRLAYRQALSRQR